MTSPSCCSDLWLSGRPDQHRDREAPLLRIGTEPGRINISQATWQHVDRLFDAEPRGMIEAKHKGTLAMFFLTGIRSEFAAAPGAGIHKVRMMKAFVQKAEGAR